MTTLPARSLEVGELVGASFDHFAVASPRIRDLVPLWIDGLGGRFRLGADNPSVGWRTVRVEFAGTMCVELIEPLGDSSFLQTFLRRHPHGGVHHVTFLVDDVKRSFEILAARGYAPFGADESWTQLFVHPRDANGVLVQLMIRRAYEYPQMTIEDVLAGRGLNGTGILSP